MSRFDQGRWNRILVWTGAALTWGSALVAARFEPIPGGDDSISEPGQSETIDAGGVMPNLPDRGLVVIRTGRAQNDESGAQPTQTVRPPRRPS